MGSILGAIAGGIRHRGDLPERRGERFGDYTEAIRNLSRDSRFPAALVLELEPLPGFRNVLIHEYVALDLGRAVEALHWLKPIEAFVGVVRGIEREGGEEPASNARAGDG